MQCRICVNSVNNKTYQIRELMYGFRDEFTYFECSNCGCLQIAEIPKNMEKYYTLDYAPWTGHRHSENLLRRFLGIQRDKYLLFKTGFIGKLYDRVIPRGYLQGILHTIANAPVNSDSRILDVGCGPGENLYLLRELGIKHLVGIDPYISKEVICKGFEILKQTIHDLPNSQKFDLVFFNHSFEHIDDQIGTVIKVAHLLNQSGVCLIRMPLKTEHVWNLYGVNWVQIDAPRHFFIHTMKSFVCLVKQAGLEIRESVFDSSSFQFWASEQYKKDIPLQAENSYFINPDISIFTPAQISEFEKMANELNRANQGDQASFYLVCNVKQTRPK